MAFQHYIPLSRTSTFTSFSTSTLKRSKLRYSPSFSPVLPQQQIQNVLHTHHPTPPSPSPNPKPLQNMTTTPTTRDSNWMFYDVARIFVRAGRGGNGVVAFRREKGVPRGGPSGGNGGNGGDVILRACSNAAGTTLSNLRGTSHFFAGDGTNGQGKNRHGVNAQDVIVHVPPGTIVRSDDGSEIVADLKASGDTYVVACGGRGGRGNAAFKTERNRAPRLCELGESGEQNWFRLELKLIAHVGLVGLPNAGKSSLLHAVSNASPKIADYPFTTVVPNLGVVEDNYVMEGEDAIVVADVPGLIDGAHRGVGMGLAFLRHIERCKIVVHIIDGSVGKDRVIQHYKDIRNEMKLFNVRLVHKLEIILLNKVDLQNVRDMWEETDISEELAKCAGHRRIAVMSAKTKEGVPKVMRKVRRLLDSLPDDEAEDDEILNVSERNNRNCEDEVIVNKVEDGLFDISGTKVKQAFDMTNWDYIEGVDRFQRILEALGVNRLLKQQGAKDGDVVRCFSRYFDYYSDENIYSAAAALDGFY